MLRFSPICLLLVAILGGPAVVPALGQGTEQRMTPQAGYYLGFGPLYEGDYHNALRVFQQAARSSIKTPQSRWIDAICYDTMCGEVCYQMGDLNGALERFTSALTIFQQFSDWMTRVNFEPSIRVASGSARKNVPWGSSTRQTTFGAYPFTSTISMGQVDANAVIRQGGVYQAANLFPITPQEIVRCTTLALRRRAALLGPVSRHDSLNDSIIAALNRPSGPSNHWSECWVDVERGLALIAGGREDQGITYLKRSVLAAGQFDHPMTSVALFELGRQSLLHGEQSTAAKFFAEAGYAAVNHYSTNRYYVPDYGILEESLRYGAITHLMSNQKGLYPPLDSAIQWAKAGKLRQLQASLLLCAAENYAALGQTALAGTMLDEARAAIGRRQMGNGVIGARLNYLTALVRYQQKRVREGDTALGAAMKYMRGGSLGLFQIGMADQLYTSGGIAARGALDVYDEVLREPRPFDWSFDPMEALSVLSTPHPLAMEHWFEAALQKNDIKDVQKAIEIADRARRHRFFTSLEFGGRLEALRSILEAPAAGLPPQALLQRQDLLMRYPAYHQLSQKAQAIRAALNKQPLVAEDQPAFKEQSRLLAELGALGGQQEVILREIALRREPSDFIFPPLRTVAEIQQSMPDKHAALVFFAAGRHLYGFLLDNERCKHWQVASLPAVVANMRTMFRTMGLFGANHEFAVKDLTDAKWKQASRQLLDLLLKGSPADFSQPCDEMVIVPDGPLWYLPFEAMQVTVNGKSQTLLSRYRIRYAPTFSLTTAERAGHNSAGNTAVVVGKLHARDNETVAREAFDRLAAVVPGAVMVGQPLPAASSLYGKLFRRLIVLDDIVVADRDPYGWSPVPMGKAGGSLVEWLALPWGGPEVVILPGFHTVAEDSLKRMGNLDIPGNDMFLSVCGLMANGARTILLSRWRTGGRTSYDLVQEFAQELPHTSPADAWQRAVMLVTDARLNFDAEPRIKHAPADETPKAAHPFFWAGYMLVDRGVVSDKAEVKPRQPAKPQQPAEPAGKEKDRPGKGKGPAAGQENAPGANTEKDAAADKPSDQPAEDGQDRPAAKREKKPNSKKKTRSTSGQGTPADRGNEEG